MKKEVLKEKIWDYIRIPLVIIFFPITILLSIVQGMLDITIDAAYEFKRKFNKTRKLNTKRIKEDYL